jgi:hypothetical protein
LNKILEKEKEKVIRDKIINIVVISVVIIIIIIINIVTFIFFIFFNNNLRFRTNPSIPLEFDDFSALLDLQSLDKGIHP